MVASQSHPEQFPSDCGTPISGLKPGVQLYTGSPGTSIKGCADVGQPCGPEKACPKPDKSTCMALDSTHSKSVYPVEAECVDGTCRIRLIKEKEPCDCLLGCSTKGNTDGLALSCINGTCAVSECAPCGQLSNGRRCCGSGILEPDGTCLCAKLSGWDCLTST